MNSFFTKNFQILSLTLAFFVVFPFSACKKDEPPQKDDDTPKGTTNAVYIINEGNFQFGNSGISFYSEGDNSAITDLFQPANNRPLGDVCHSMYLHNGKAYLVVNNSGKVEVVDEKTFISSATISGFNSPRYFLPLSSTKAYVTDIYDNAISVVNLSTNSITGKIPCKGWTENLIYSNGKVFVTNQLSDKVFVINPQTDQVSDSISVGYSSNSIVKDKNGKLWVLCGGDPDKSRNASLHRINPETNVVETSFDFGPLTQTPWQLNINGGGDTLYYLNTSCYRMAITESSLPVNEFIAAGGRNIIAIGVNPNTGKIYLSDAIDYIQAGKIFVYSANAQLYRSFNAGIIPRAFCFGAE